VTPPESGSDAPDDAATGSDGGGDGQGGDDTPLAAWGELFDRAANRLADREVDEADVTAALAAVRSDTGRSETADTGEGDRDGDDDAGAGDGRPAPSPARVVADADVLAADLLGVGAARAALDPVRAHSWTTLVASDQLLADATATVDRLLADPADDLLADWRDRLVAWREPVGHPTDDQPALASAYRGGAMHALSFDDRLTGPRTGAALQGHVPVSVRRPDAFAALFDADSLYREVVGGDYPGPDRDPRG
jgi:hypothetical protein